MNNTKKTKIIKELLEKCKNTNALERLFIFQELAKKYKIKHVDIMQLYFTFN